MKISAELLFREGAIIASKPAIGILGDTCPESFKGEQKTGVHA